MGCLVRIVENQPVVQPRTRRGAAVEVVRAGSRRLSYLCRLELSLPTPLSEYTRGFTPLAAPSQELDAEVTLPAGVWGLSAGRPAYLLVGLRAEVSVLTRAQAFCALGAVAALQALGLEDAAVALASGDYDLAMVQWLMERERRRREGSS
jgi:hypothetical protein